MSALVDGFVAGTWDLAQWAESTSIRVQPYVRLRGEVRDEITSEGNRLLDHAFDVGRGCRFVTVPDQ